MAIDVPQKIFKHSETFTGHDTRALNPNYKLCEREFNNVIRKIEKQMFTLDFTEMDNQSKKIAERLRCSCCMTLPASLRLMECRKCASIICLQCRDKILGRIFGESDTDDENNNFEDQIHGQTRNNTTFTQ